MFELKDIDEAHSKVESGADFPLYILALKNLGVTMYSTFMIDGHTVYFGENSFEIKSKRKYFKLRIANICDKERFKHYLKNHQRGQTDYSTFCSNSAETGVDKWTVDIDNMTCTYFDKANNKMLEEVIPTSS